jgi:hypothetical protein
VFPSQDEEDNFEATIAPKVPGSGTTVEEPGFNPASQSQLDLGL